MTPSQRQRGIAFYVTGWALSSFPGIIRNMYILLISGGSKITYKVSPPLLGRKCTKINYFSIEIKGFKRPIQVHAHAHAHAIASLRPLSLFSSPLLYLYFSLSLSFFLSLSLMFAVYQHVLIDADSSTMHAHTHTHAHAHVHVYACVNALIDRVFD